MIRQFHLRRNLKEQKGQSLVELALVLPILFVLLMGMIQFGFIFNGHITVTSATREGARLAVVGADDDEVELRIVDAAVSPLLTVERSRINIVRGTGSDETVRVSVVGSVDIIVPMLPMLTGSSVDVSSESVMRMEK